MLRVGIERRAERGRVDCLREKERPGLKYTSAAFFSCQGYTVCAGQRRNDVPELVIQREDGMVPVRVLPWQARAASQPKNQTASDRRISAAGVTDIQDFC